VGERYQRPVMILDLAIPRDFEPAIGDLVGVFLYSIDDLKTACERNRREREKEWPKAERIIEDETGRFMADLHHRATAPTIRRLKERADEVKSEELARLLNKLGSFDGKSQAEITAEITAAFDRLINKLLHPPLESLRDEAQHGTPHGLLEALKRLFQLKD
jgi:glutamyl-tRNA reductase